MGCPRLYDIENLSNDSVLSLWRADEKIGLSDYRYGFNGKELDNEGMGGGGSTYDYGFRIYNPQIAKFLSVDPLSDSYPWNSPYAFAENDVIRSIDLDGLEKYVTIIEWSSDGKTCSSYEIVTSQKQRDNLYKLFLTNYMDGNISSMVGMDEYHKFKLISMYKHDNLTQAPTLYEKATKPIGRLTIIKNPNGSLSYEYDTYEGDYYNTGPQKIITKEPSMAEIARKWVIDNKKGIKNIASSMKETGDAAAITGLTAAAIASPTVVGSAPGLTFAAIGEGTSLLGSGLEITVDIITGDANSETAIDAGTIITGKIIDVGIDKVLPGPTPDMSREISEGIQVGNEMVKKAYGEALNNASNNLKAQTTTK